jgi:hypothetical protein
VLPQTAALAIESAPIPAQAVRDLYNFRTIKDTKIYKMAANSLIIQHNGTVDTLRPMLDKLYMQGKELNWTSLITIPDNKGELCNLIIQNRALAMQDITAFAASYAAQQTSASKNADVTSTNITAGTNIKFSNQLTVGNDTDVTRNNTRMTWHLVM